MPTITAQPTKNRTDPIDIPALLAAIEGERFVVAGDAAVALHGHPVHVEVVELICSEQRPILERLGVDTDAAGEVVDARVDARADDTDHGRVIVMGSLPIAQGRTISARLVEASATSIHDVAVLSESHLNTAARWSTTMSRDGSWTAINRLQRRAKPDRPDLGSPTR